MPRGGVSNAERVITWGSSIVIGVAAFYLADAALTAGPKAEAARVKGRIDALTTPSLARPRELSPEEARAARAEGRARSSHLRHLEKRRSDLRHDIDAKHFWAIAIGLVAGFGSFALCGVYAYRRAAAGTRPPR